MKQFIQPDKHIINIHYHPRGLDGWLVDDDDPRTPGLATKIMSLWPHFDFVIKDGALVDVVDDPEARAEYEARIAEADGVLSSAQRIADLELEVAGLRDEIDDLRGEQVELHGNMRDVLAELSDALADVSEVRAAQIAAAGGGLKEREGEALGTG